MLTAAVLLSIPLWLERIWERRPSWKCLRYLTIWRHRSGNSERGESEGRSFRRVRRQDRRPRDQIAVCLLLLMLRWYCCFSVSPTASNKFVTLFSFAPSSLPLVLFCSLSSSSRKKPLPLLPSLYLTTSFSPLSSRHLPRSELCVLSFEFYGTSLWPYDQDKVVKYKRTRVLVVSRCSSSFCLLYNVAIFTFDPIQIEGWSRQLRIKSYRRTSF